MTDFTKTEIDFLDTHSYAKPFIKKLGIRHFKILLRGDPEVLNGDIMDAVACYERQCGVGSGWQGEPSIFP